MILDLFLSRLKNIDQYKIIKEDLISESIITIIDCSSQNPSKYCPSSCSVRVQQGNLITDAAYFLSFFGQAVIIYCSEIKSPLTNCQTPSMLK